MLCTHIAICFYMNGYLVQLKSQLNLFKFIDIHHNGDFRQLNIYIYIYIYMCVCVCMLFMLVTFLN